MINLAHRNAGTELPPVDVDLEFVNAVLCSDKSGKSYRISHLCSFQFEDRACTFPGDKSRGKLGNLENSQSTTILGPG